MENGKESYRILLSRAAEMGGMMYWRYFCDRGELEVSDQLFSCLGIEDLFGRDETSKRECFAGYVNRISADKRERFREIISGCRSQEQGVLLYQVDWNGESRYHKCMYFTIGEGSEKIVAGVIQDLTQLKRQEERNARIIEAIPDFIFIFDKNFFIRDVLKSDEIKLLHPVDYLIGADGRDVYAPEVSRMFIDAIDQCLAAGGLQEIEYPLDADDGLRYYFQARMVPFDHDKVMALIHDIRDRVRFTEDLIRAKKKAEEADHMKSAFLANMSHEIRTPLNAIVGFSELLLSSDEQDKETYMEIVRQNSELLLQLIDDILDLSRLEAGKTEMHYQQVELNKLLDEIGQIHEVKMKPGVALVLDRPGEPVWLLTDKNRLTQVLFNFLSNAIKNTVQGKIALRLENEENEWVRISVEDTGCGIPQEQLETVFDRFTKINDFVQGTGLGLTICHTIAGKLGGKIEVSSVYGQGSTFSILLPVGAEEKTGHTWSKPEHEPATPVVAVERKKILVAEDVDANYLLARAILKKEYEIVRASDGKEAVRMFRTEKPDLILMDIKMPLLDGIEATRLIRGYSGTIPIVAVTAHAFSADKQKAFEAGCNEVVLKPYTPDVLKSTINRFLS